MVLRLQQGAGKFLIETDDAATLRLQQGAGKFLVGTADAATLRLQQGVAKFLVRAYPVQRIAKVFPPMDTTIAQAPYVRIQARR